MGRLQTGRESTAGQPAPHCPRERGGDLDVPRCGLVVFAAGFVQPQSLLVQVVHAALHRGGPGEK